MVLISLARNSNWGPVCDVSTGNFTKVYEWKAFGVVSDSAVGTGGAQPAAQTAGKGPRLLPQGVSNTRDSSPSLEIKQIRSDDGMEFLGKRGKQFSNILSELLQCASGREKRRVVVGKARGAAPRFHHQAWIPKPEGWTPAWRHHKWSGFEETQNPASLSGR